MALLEKEEGKNLIKLLAYAKVKVGDDYEPLLDYFIHIPNGGTRNVREGLSLKQQGTKAGVSDYLLAYPTSKYAGLWIELKRNVKTAVVSKEQKKWINRMKRAGYYACVCYGANDAMVILQAYLNKDELTH
jgi:hypothetical protein